MGNPTPFLVLRAGGNYLDVGIPYIQAKVLRLSFKPEMATGLRLWLICVVDSLSNNSYGHVGDTWL